MLVNLFRRVLAVGLIVLVGRAATLGADADTAAVPPAKPTTAIEQANCVTSQCHANVKKHKMLHGPINVNACDACHSPVDVSKHTFKLARKKETLCTFCHKIDLTDAKVVHKPVKTGDCVMCHDPHGGFDRFSLRSQSMGKLCANCHEDVTHNKKVKHGPVAAGACGACHAPHKSQNKNLLLLTGRDLCLSCHQEMKQQLQNTQFKHEPVEKDCRQCHDPHASDHTMMLHESPLKICTASCHEEKRKAIASAKYKHSAVTKDAACVNCHTPHGGSLDHLMVDKPINICLKCHNKPIKVSDERTVPAMIDLVNPKFVKHGIIVQGSCDGCHNVHGSEISRLLTKPYPETFYESFDLKKYDLCFNCHDKQLVLLPETKGLTGFRNGDKNLHYLHVNKAKRGRSCRACHAVHTAQRKVLIRESVPYGKWELPIHYTPSANGGTCSPGCHQKLSYDRNYVPPAPVAAPAAPPAATAAPPASGSAAGPAKSANTPAVTSPASPTDQPDQSDKESQS